MSDLTIICLYATEYDFFEYLRLLVAGERTKNEAKRIAEKYKPQP